MEKNNIKIYLEFNSYLQLGICQPTLKIKSVLQIAFFGGVQTEQQKSGLLSVLEEMNYDVIFLICFKPNSKTEYNVNIQNSSFTIQVLNIK